jgi:hypothetical protein
MAAIIIHYALHTTRVFTYKVVVMHICVLQVLVLTEKESTNQLDLGRQGHFDALWSRCFIPCTAFTDPQSALHTVVGSFTSD